MESLANSNLLADIRNENLSVYRSSPQRLREDVGQESQIAQDYRGRLIYELLQNADDAMEAEDGDARICFRLTSDALWVANSGRPLDDADIRGLCGISASSKRVSGKRRASIGHKGMGFKSVLEISEAPEVYSTTVCFRFSPQDALKAVQSLVDEKIVPPVKRAPICRFPWVTNEAEAAWSTFRERGFRTAFRFPLRAKDRSGQHDRLQHALETLPVSSLLFLKRLKRVEIELSGEPGSEPITWTVRRQRQGFGATIAPAASLSESGVYWVGLANGASADYSFLVAYDAEIPIGANRGGLNEFAWEGVELTEGAVAARFEAGKVAELPADWRRLHVFLPSAEPCPYDLLISAAFNSNLSRQEIKVDSTADDYNRHVLGHIARLFRDCLLPAVIRAGTDVAEVMSLLRRRSDPNKPTESRAAQAVYEAFKAAISQFPLIPTESGSLIPVSACVTPPLVSDAVVGNAFRQVLPASATHDKMMFPADRFCGGNLSRILVDHGAYELTPAEAAVHLADPDPGRSMLKDHSSGGVNVDPVLSVLQGLWSGLGYQGREQLVQMVRNLPLFPVSAANGRVIRIKTNGLQCFYPPRSLKGEIGLSSLCFLLQDLCWGALSPAERNAMLSQDMTVWQALFELREFKFPDVMRASVLPALDLDSDTSDPRRDNLRALDALAAICQLAGRMPDASKPLPYERLGPNRALFNLSRLDVPCRGTDQDIKWVPAYRAYLGEDWVGELSFERVCKTIAATGEPPPNVDFLISPDRFTGLLDRFRHLQQATGDDSEDVGDEEVAIDEDEESALDSDDRSRWLEFFSWIGVNVVLRAVHFHDVEDRASGWLKTRELRQPDGWAFRSIPGNKWNGFLAGILPAVISEVEKKPEADQYFYQLHDLEHIVHMLDVAAKDATATIGGSFYEHLARNWQSLERFCQLDIALVAGEPARRVKPPRARDEEILELDESNFWVYRLRAAPVCPTGHGPRKPSEAWLPTQEVLRRFGRRNKEASACLLPAIDLPAALLKGRARGLMQAMGVREELSPASFTIADALVVLRRLQDVYGNQVKRGDDLRQELREVIRPAYRHVLELLSGNEGDAADAALGQAPLLVQDGLGHLEFRDARDVFYADRRDTRDRLQTNAPLWTFVLEAYPTGRTPLVKLLGCRVLEESLHWSPRVGDPALAEPDKATWRLRLRELAPFLLARVGADRVDETLARRDAAGLRALIASLEPVTEIRLRCTLDGHFLPSTEIEREAFVEAKDGSPGGMLAFVRWSEGTWPPTEDDAEALATAFGEVLGSGYFESFLALIRAPSTAKRESLLRRAGAPTDVEERRLLFDSENEPQKPDHASSQDLSAELKTTAGETDGEQPAQQPRPATQTGDQPKQVPLYSPGQIIVDGVPVILVGVAGKLPHRDTGQPGHSDGNGDDKPGDGDGRGYGGHTDLGALNALGMAVTLSYELVRLRKAGLRDATVWDPAILGPQLHACVFDVSSPARIAMARASSQQFDRAFRRLIEVHGVPAEWPGFDVLTLSPSDRDAVDRLIELKSSGVCSRIQEMSWNEWKSARSNQLRHRFYLYLVGNLRSDLNGSRPFVRTIRDPFEQLLAEVQVSNRVERRVQLAVHLFREAEHLDLTVTGPAHS